MARAPPKDTPHGWAQPEGGAQQALHWAFRVFKRWILRSLGESACAGRPNPKEQWGFPVGAPTTR